MVRDIAGCEKVTNRGQGHAWPEPHEPHEIHEIHAHADDEAPASHVGATGAERG